MAASRGGGERVSFRLGGVVKVILCTVRTAVCLKSETPHTAVRLFIKVERIVATVREANNINICGNSCSVGWADHISTFQHLQSLSSTPRECRAKSPYRGQNNLKTAQIWSRMDRDR